MDCDADWVIDSTSVASCVLVWVTVAEALEEAPIVLHRPMSPMKMSPVQSLSANVTAWMLL